MLRKMISLHLECVDMNAPNINKLIKKIEVFLRDNRLVPLTISPIKLEGVLSLGTVLDCRRTESNASHILLKKFSNRLRDLRLDLKKLEPIHPDAEPLRKSLDQVMDTLEIPKDYFWLETHFPGETFREGIARFYHSNGVLLYHVKSTMHAINSSIDEPDFRFKSVGSLEALFQGLDRFVQQTRYGFTEDYWTHCAHKSVFVEGTRFLQKAYFETLLKSEDLPSPLSWSTEPKRFDYQQAHEAIVKRLLPILEHLCVQYHKLQLDSLDGPPNLAFMSSLPAIREHTLDDPPVQPRKLQRMLPSEEEITIYL